MYNIHMFNLHIDRELLIWLWGIPSFICVLWPSIYFWKEKSYSEEELAKISSRFNGINGKNYAWSFLWFFLVTIVIFGWNHKFDYPLFVLILSGLAITHAAFSLNYGVYPIPKMFSYYYVDSLLNRRIAKIQITIALTLSIISLLSNR